MDMPTIEALKRARIKWLDVSFSYKDKNHFIEIRTPFPDMFHDNISLVLYKDADGNLMLSDDGYTMDELGTLGFDTNTSVKRKKYFNDTLLSFGVQYAQRVSQLSKYLSSPNMHRQNYSLFNASRRLAICSQLQEIEPKTYF